MLTRAVCVLFVLVAQSSFAQNVLINGDFEAIPLLGPGQTDVPPGGSKLFVVNDQLPFFTNGVLGLPGWISGLNGDGSSDSGPSRQFAADGERCVYINNWNRRLSQVSTLVVMPGQRYRARVAASTFADMMSRAGPFTLVAGEPDPANPDQFTPDSIVLGEVTVGTSQWTQFQPDVVLKTGEWSQLTIDYAAPWFGPELGKPLTVSFRTEIGSAGPMLWDQASLEVVEPKGSGVPAEYWQVAGNPANSLSAALNIVENFPPTVTALVSIIDFNDNYGSPPFCCLGHFDADTLFPGVVPIQGDPSGEDFVVRITGLMYIPRAGDWTFGAVGDDGMQLKIDGVPVLEFEGAPFEGFSTVNLTEGIHQVQIVYFAWIWSDLLEVFAKPGTASKFDSEFRLLGDVANGGLLLIGSKPQVVAVTITPDSVTTPAGFSADMSTTAILDDDSTLDVSTAAAWSTADPNIATVSNTGLVTGQKEGATTLFAAFDGVVGSAEVFVQPLPSPLPIERINTTSSGEQANAQVLTDIFPVVSSDGRWVVFASAASNLVEGDTNNVSDVFVKDLQTGEIRRVSVSSSGEEANGPSNAPSISGNGRYVSFRSAATNLVPGDTNEWPDVFVHDLQTGQTIRASVTANGEEVKAVHVYASRLSYDGRYVAFDLVGQSLIPGDSSMWHIYRKDLWTGEVLDAHTDSNQVPANDSFAAYSTISADGRYVAFDSYASNLVPDDTNNTVDAFVKDLETGAIERVSVNNDGIEANGASIAPNLDASGRYVLFLSDGTNLSSLPNNNWRDLYIRDRVMGTTTAVTVGFDGLLANGNVGSGSISGNGRYVLFRTPATNIIPGYGQDGVSQLYRVDRVSGEIQIVTDGPVGPGNAPTEHGSVLDHTGATVIFPSAASNLVPWDSNNAIDLFRRQMPACGSDVTGADSVVNVSDLLAVISNWGASGPSPADVNGDLVVDVADLLAVIASWGPCG